ncbi:hypothetical protein B5S28_g4753 [[Candida] boidinii]|nr:hypothetical protein B5S28_g4753 [[Candida] boidinii]OWB63978.1 hypothetical protein B5S29_g5000 [[Candida] boidinii]OWB77503.1 hypothetical protein B5S32_g1671 [[Candida] boidinii]
MAQDLAWNLMERAIKLKLNLHLAVSSAATVHASSGIGSGIGSPGLPANCCHICHWPRYPQQPGCPLHPAYLVGDRAPTQQAAAVQDETGTAAEHPAQPSTGKEDRERRLTDG